MGGTVTKDALRCTNWVWNAGSTMLRSRKGRTIVGVGALVLIPALVPFLGLTPTYGKAQLSRAGSLIDLVCAADPGTGRLRCDGATEIRRGTRRDDWWAVGYVVLGTVAALCLVNRRARRPVLSIIAVALLVLGGAADVVENAKLRNSMSALLSTAGFDSRAAAIAAVGDNPDATVLFGRFKTGFLAVALLVVIGSQFRRSSD